MATSNRDRYQHALEAVLSDRGASSEDGCSALGNALLAAFVRLRQDRAISPAVALEMRRFAARLTQLADAPPEDVAHLAVALSDVPVLTGHG